jgi:hypothetical protein
MWITTYMFNLTDRRNDLTVLRNNCTRRVGGRDEVLRFACSLSMTVQTATVGHVQLTFSLQSVRFVMCVPCESQNIPRTVFQRRHQEIHLNCIQLPLFEVWTESIFIFFYFFYFRKFETSGSLIPSALSQQHDKFWTPGWWPYDYNMKIYNFMNSWNMKWKQILIPQKITILTEIFLPQRCWNWTRVTCIVIL